MKNAQLVLPSSQYKESFITAVKEYQKEGLLQYLDLDIENLQKDFEEYTKGILVQAEGKNLPEGYVPMTRYWLVDNSEFIGRFDIRHELNSFLRKEGGHIGYDIRPSKRKQGYGSIGLELTLLKAKQMGLRKVLLTCDNDNQASIKIIEKCGGVLDKDKDSVEKYLYWIELY